MCVQCGLTPTPPPPALSPALGVPLTPRRDPVPHGEAAVGGGWTPRRNTLRNDMRTPEARRSRAPACAGSVEMLYGVFLCSTPNGGQRNSNLSRAVRAQLKRMGCCPNYWRF